MSTVKHSIVTTLSEVGLRRLFANFIHEQRKDTTYNPKNGELRYNEVNKVMRELVRKLPHDIDLAPSLNRNSHIADLGYHIVTKKNPDKFASLESDTYCDYIDTTIFYNFKLADTINKYYTDSVYTHYDDDNLLITDVDYIYFETLNELGWKYDKLIHTILIDCDDIAHIALLALLNKIDIRMYYSMFDIVNDDSHLEQFKTLLLTELENLHEIRMSNKLVWVQTVKETSILNERFRLKRNAR